MIDTRNASKKEEGYDAKWAFGKQWRKSEQEKLWEILGLLTWVTENGGAIKRNYWIS